MALSATAKPTTTTPHFQKLSRFKTHFSRDLSVIIFNYLSLPPNKIHLLYKR